MISRNHTIKGVFGFILFSFFLFTSCKKDWLDAKPNRSLVVFSTISDYQAMLDNIGVCHSTPALGEIGGDNYYIRQAALANLDPSLIISYIWAPAGWDGTLTINDWLNTYKLINYANLSLEGLTKIPVTANNEASWNAVKGTALFIRSVAFHNLATLFAKKYEKNSENSAPGIPLRTETDPNLKVGRFTVKEVYERVLVDLVSAIEFLPNASNYQIRPTKQAAYGMLARIYLSLEDYENAELYSSKYLEISRNLIDYNNLALTGSTSMPSPINNIEVMYFSKMQTNFLTQSRTDIDSNLLKSYGANDLRRSVYYRTSGTRVIYAGSYTGNVTEHFTGIATDEILLIRAECYARNNKVSESMADLNYLLKNRLNKAGFVDIVAGNKTEALKIVLAERRKELVMRSLRWSDLRRLNNDPLFATTIKRYVNGKEYILAPNENKYVWPITNDEILYSGIEQNPR